MLPSSNIGPQFDNPSSRSHVHKSFCKEAYICPLRPGANFIELLSREKNAYQKYLLSRFSKLPAKLANAISVFCCLAKIFA